jgi:hypothetical protein
VLHAKAKLVAEPLFAEQMGLDPRSWAILLCEDDDGVRWTVAGDPAVAEMISAVDLQQGPVVVPPDSFPVRRKGWPEDWFAVGESGAAEIRNDAPPWQD